MGLLNNFINFFRGKVRLAYTGSWDYANKSTPFRGDTWENDIFRSTVDAIATHAAKGKALHVIMDTKTGHIKETKHNSKYARLLNERPNPIMSGTEFKYRMIAQLETYTTAIAYIRWEEAEPEMVIPIDYTSFEFLKIGNGAYAIKVEDHEGNENYLMMEDCVVMRKFYNKRLAAGDGNGPIYKVFDMSQASDEGFIESLAVSNKVRGIHKHKQAMLREEDVRKSQADFNERFDKAAREGGIVSIDSMEEYVPIQINPYNASASQMDRIAKRIHLYLRTPEEIVLSKYTESQGLAWYESVIEPIWDMFGEALTNAFFTRKERGFGNRIMFSRGVMMGTSYQTRNNIIAVTKELGLLTINEFRELLGYEPIEGGDIRQVSLNYIDADKQSEYQTGKSDEPAPKDDYNGDGSGEANQEGDTSV